MNAKDSSVQGDLHALFEAQRQAFRADPMPGPGQRRAALDALARLIVTHQDALAEAIASDFGGRPLDETRLIDLFPALGNVHYARRHVARWMKPERRNVSLWFLPGRAQVRYQPLGVVGIVVPWNFPILLAVGPLAAALAAGNRAMIKMSEYSPRSGALFARLIAEVFPPDQVTVVNGDVAVATAFSALPFDHLCFTGSTAVGRQVMAAAAKNLTPVTLELGGKSPAIVAPGFDLALAARRIVTTKLLNCGQACVAPDYVLLPRGQEEAFLAAAREAARRLYGNAASPDLASLATDRQYARVTALVEDARVRGARVEPLLEGDPGGARRLSPVLLLGVTDEMQAMRDEIFGPVLPVLPYDSLDEAIDFVVARDRPLALYVFDTDRRRVRDLLDRTASGGVTVNDCMFHLGQEDLPFGGIGPSGIGRYHGPEGFKTFSHARAVFEQARWNGLPLLTAPYGGRLARRLLRLMLR